MINFFEKLGLVKIKVVFSNKAECIFLSYYYIMICVFSQGQLNNQLTIYNSNKYQGLYINVKQARKTVDLFCVKNMKTLIKKTSLPDEL